MGSRLRWWEALRHVQAVATLLAFQRWSRDRLRLSRVCRVKSYNFFIAPRCLQVERLSDPVAPVAEILKRVPAKTLMMLYKIQVGQLRLG